MTTTDSAPSLEPDARSGVDEIQADIERTRAELGQTVEALSHKLDVKGRAKDKAKDTLQSARDAATDDEGKVKPAPPAIALAVIVLVVGIIVWRRRA